MRMRVFIVLCVFTLLSVAFSVSAYAMTASDNVIEPHWTNTASMTVNLSINNGRAVMTGSVIANTGTERIAVTAVLERVNANDTTTHLGSWTTSANGNIWIWERPHYVARGHYYRLTLTATVTRNGVDEVISFDRTARAH